MLYDSYDAVLYFVELNIYIFLNALLSSQRQYQAFVKRRAFFAERKITGTIRNVTASSSSCQQFVHFPDSVFHLN